MSDHITFLSSVPSHNFAKSRDEENSPPRGQDRLQHAFQPLVAQFVERFIQRGHLGSAIGQVHIAPLISYCSRMMVDLSRRNGIILLPLSRANRLSSSQTSKHNTLLNFSSSNLISSLVYFEVFAYSILVFLVRSAHRPSPMLSSPILKSGALLHPHIQSLMRQLITLPADHDECKLYMEKPYLFPTYTNCASPDTIRNLDFDAPPVMSTLLYVCPSTVVCKYLYSTLQGRSQNYLLARIIDLTSSSNDGMASAPFSAGSIDPYVAPMLMDSSTSSPLQQFTAAHPSWQSTMGDLMARRPQVSGSQMYQVYRPLILFCLVSVEQLQDILGQDEEKQRAHMLLRKRFDEEFLNTKRASVPTITSDANERTRARRIKAIAHEFTSFTYFRQYLQHFSTIIVHDLMSLVSFPVQQHLVEVLALPQHYGNVSHDAALMHVLSQYRHPSQSVPSQVIDLESRPTPARASVEAPDMKLASTQHRLSSKYRDLNQRTFNEVYHCSVFVIEYFKVLHDIMILYTSIEVQTLLHSFISLYDVFFPHQSLGQPSPAKLSAICSASTSHVYFLAKSIVLSEFLKTPFALAQMTISGIALYLQQLRLVVITASQMKAVFSQIFATHLTSDVLRTQGLQGSIQLDIDSDVTREIERAGHHQIYTWLNYIAFPIPVVPNNGTSTSSKSSSHCDDGDDGSAHHSSASDTAPLQSELHRLQHQHIVMPREISLSTIQGHLLLLSALRRMKFDTFPSSDIPVHLLDSSEHSKVTEGIPQRISSSPCRFAQLCDSFLACFLHIMPDAFMSCLHTILTLTRSDPPSSQMEAVTPEYAAQLPISQRSYIVGAFLYELQIANLHSPQVIPQIERQRGDPFSTSCEEATGIDSDSQVEVAPAFKPILPLLEMLVGSIMPRIIYKLDSPLLISGSEALKTSALLPLQPMFQLQKTIHQYLSAVLPGLQTLLSSSSSSIGAASDSSASSMASLVSQYGHQYLKSILSVYKEIDLFLATMNNDGGSDVLQPSSQSATPTTAAIRTHSQLIESKLQIVPYFSQSLAVVSAKSSSHPSHGSPQIAFSAIGPDLSRYAKLSESDKPWIISHQDYQLVEFLVAKVKAFTQSQHQFHKNSFFCRSILYLSLLLNWASLSFELESTRRSVVSHNSHQQHDQDHLPPPKPFSVALCLVFALFEVGTKAIYDVYQKSIFDDRTKRSSTTSSTPCDLDNDYLASIFTQTMNEIHSVLFNPGQQQGEPTTTTPLVGSLRDVNIVDVESILSAMLSSNQFIFQPQFAFHSAPESSSMASPHHHRLAADTTRHVLSLLLASDDLLKQIPTGTSILQHLQTSITPHSAHSAFLQPLIRSKFPDPPTHNLPHSYIECVFHTFFPVLSSTLPSAIDIWRAVTNHTPISHLTSSLCPLESHTMVALEDLLCVRDTTLLPPRGIILTASEGESRYVQYLITSLPCHCSLLHRKASSIGIVDDTQLPSTSRSHSNSFDEQKELLHLHITHTIEVPTASKSSSAEESAICNYCLVKSYFTARIYAPQPKAIDSSLITQGNSLPPRPPIPSTQQLRKLTGLSLMNSNSDDVSSLLTKTMSHIISYRGKESSSQMAKTMLVGDQIVPTPSQAPHGAHQEADATQESESSSIVQDMSDTVALDQGSAMDDGDEDPFSSIYSEYMDHHTVNLLCLPATLSVHSGIVAAQGGFLYDRYTDTLEHLSSLLSIPSHPLHDRLTADFVVVYNPDSHPIVAGDARPALTSTIMATLTSLQSASSHSPSMPDLVPTIIQTLSLSHFFHSVLQSYSLTTLYETYSMSCGAPIVLLSPCTFQSSSRVAQHTDLLTPLSAELHQMLAAPSSIQQFVDSLQASQFPLTSSALALVYPTLRLVAPSIAGLRTQQPPARVDMTQPTVPTLYHMELEQLKSFVCRSHSVNRRLDFPLAQCTAPYTSIEPSTEARNDQPGGCFVCDFSPPPAGQTDPSQLIPPTSLTLTAPAVPTLLSGSILPSASFFYPYLLLAVAQVWDPLVAHASLPAMFTVMNHQLQSFFREQTLLRFHSISKYPLIRSLSTVGGGGPSQQHSPVASDNTYLSVKAHQTILLESIIQKPAVKQVKYQGIDISNQVYLGGAPLQAPPSTFDTAKYQLYHHKSKKQTGYSSLSECRAVLEQFYQQVIRHLARLDKLLVSISKSFERAIMDYLQGNPATLRSLAIPYARPLGYIMFLCKLKESMSPLLQELVTLASNSQHGIEDVVPLVISTMLHTVSTPGSNQPDQASFQSHVIFPGFYELDPLYIQYLRQTAQSTTNEPRYDFTTIQAKLSSKFHSYQTASQNSNTYEFPLPSMSASRLYSSFVPLEFHRAVLPTTPLPPPLGDYDEVVPVSGTPHTLASSTDPSYFKQSVFQLDTTSSVSALAARKYKYGLPLWMYSSALIQTDPLTHDLPDYTFSNLSTTQKTAMDESQYLAMLLTVQQLAELNLIDDKFQPYSDNELKLLDFSKFNQLYHVLKPKLQPYQSLLNFLSMVVAVIPSLSQGIYSDALTQGCTHSVSASTQVDLTDDDSVPASDSTQSQAARSYLPFLPLTTHRDGTCVYCKYLIHPRSIPYSRSPLLTTQSDMVLDVNQLPSCLLVPNQLNEYGNLLWELFQLQSTRPTKSLLYLSDHLKRHLCLKCDGCQRVQEFADNLARGQYFFDFRWLESYVHLANSSSSHRPAISQHELVRMLLGDTSALPSPPSPTSQSISQSAPHADHVPTTTSAVSPIGDNSSNSSQLTSDPVAASQSSSLDTLSGLNHDEETPTPTMPTAPPLDPHLPSFLQPRPFFRASPQDTQLPLQSPGSDHQQTHDDEESRSSLDTTTTPPQGTTPPSSATSSSATAQIEDQITNVIPKSAVSPDASNAHAFRLIRDHSWPTLPDTSPGQLVYDSLRVVFRYLKETQQATNFKDYSPAALRNYISTFYDLKHQLLTAHNLYQSYDFRSVSLAPVLGYFESSTLSSALLTLPEPPRDVWNDVAESTSLSPVPPPLEALLSADRHVGPSPTAIDVYNSMLPLLGVSIERESSSFYLESLWAALDEIQSDRQMEFMQMNYLISRSTVVYQEKTIAESKALIANGLPADSKTTSNKRVIQYTADAMSDIFGRLASVLNALPNPTALFPSASAPFMPLFDDNFTTIRMAPKWGSLLKLTDFSSLGPSPVAMATDISQDSSNDTIPVDHSTSPLADVLPIYSSRFHNTLYPISAALSDQPIGHRYGISRPHLLTILSHLLPTTVQTYVDLYYNRLATPGFDPSEQFMFPTLDSFASGNPQASSYLCVSDTEMDTNGEDMKSLATSMRWVSHIFEHLQKCLHSEPATAEGELSDHSDTIKSGFLPQFSRITQSYHDILRRIYLLSLEFPFYSSLFADFAKLMLSIAFRTAAQGHTSESDLSLVLPILPPHFVTQSGSPAMISPYISVNERRPAFNLHPTYQPFSIIPQRNTFTRDLWTYYYEPQTFIFSKQQFHYFESLIAFTHYLTMHNRFPQFIIPRQVTHYRSAALGYSSTAKMARILAQQQCRNQISSAITENRTVKQTLEVVRRFGLVHVNDTLFSPRNIAILLFYYLHMHEMAPTPVSNATQGQNTSQVAILLDYLELISRGVPLSLFSYDPRIHRNHVPRSPSIRSNNDSASHHNTYPRALYFMLQCALSSILSSKGDVHISSLQPSLVDLSHALLRILTTSHVTLVGIISAMNNILQRVYNHGDQRLTLLLETIDDHYFPWLHPTSDLDDGNLPPHPIYPVTIKKPSPPILMQLPRIINLLSKYVLTLNLIHTNMRTRIPFPITLPLTSLFMFTNIYPEQFWTQLQTLGKVLSSTCSNLFASRGYQPQSSQCDYQTLLFYNLNHLANPMMWLDMAYYILLRAFDENTYYFEHSCYQQTRRENTSYTIPEYKTKTFQSSSYPYELANTCDVFILKLGSCENKEQLTYITVPFRDELNLSSYYLPTPAPLVHHDLRVSVDPHIRQATVQTPSSSTDMVSIISRYMVDTTLANYASFYSHRLSGSKHPGTPPLDTLVRAAIQLLKLFIRTIKESYPVTFAGSSGPRLSFSDDDIRRKRLKNSHHLPSSDIVQLESPESPSPTESPFPEEINVLDWLSESILEPALGDVLRSQHTLSPIWHHYYITVVIWPSLNDGHAYDPLVDLKSTEEDLLVPSMVETEDSNHENGTEIAIAETSNPDIDAVSEVNSVKFVQRRYEQLEEVNNGAAMEMIVNDATSEVPSGVSPPPQHQTQPSTPDQPAAERSSPLLNNTNPNDLKRPHFSLQHWFYRQHLKGTPHLDEASHTPPHFEPRVLTLSMTFTTPFALSSGLVNAPLRYNHHMEIYLTPVFHVVHNQDSATPQDTSHDATHPKGSASLTCFPYVTDLMLQQQSTFQELQDIHPFIHPKQSKTLGLHPLLVPPIDMFSAATEYYTRVISLSQNGSTPFCFASIFNAVDFHVSQQPASPPALSPATESTTATTSLHPSPCFTSAYALDRYPLLKEVIACEAQTAVFPYHLYLDRVAKIKSTLDPTSSGLACSNPAAEKTIDLNLVVSAHIAQSTNTLHTESDPLPSLESSDVSALSIKSYLCLPLTHLPSYLDLYVSMEAYAQVLAKRRYINIDVNHTFQDTDAAMAWTGQRHPDCNFRAAPLDSCVELHSLASGQLYLEPITFGVDQSIFEHFHPNHAPDLVHSTPSGTRVSTSPLCTPNTLVQGPEYVVSTSPTACGNVSKSIQRTIHKHNPVLVDWIYLWEVAQSPIISPYSYHDIFTHSHGAHSHGDEQVIGNKESIHQLNTPIVLHNSNHSFFLDPKHLGTVSTSLLDFQGSARFDQFNLPSKLNSIETLAEAILNYKVVPNELDHLKAKTPWCFFSLKNEANEVPLLLPSRDVCMNLLTYRYTPRQASDQVYVYQPPIQDTSALSSTWVYPNRKKAYLRLPAMYDLYQNTPFFQYCPYHYTNDIHQSLVEASNAAKYEVNRTFHGKQSSPSDHHNASTKPSDPSRVFISNRRQYHYDVNCLWCLCSSVGPLYLRSFHTSMGGRDMIHAEWSARSFISKRAIRNWKCISFSHVVSALWLLFYDFQSTLLRVIPQSLLPIPTSKIQLRQRGDSASSQSGSTNLDSMADDDLFHTLVTTHQITMVTPADHNSTDNSDVNATSNNLSPSAVLSKYILPNPLRYLVAALQSCSSLRSAFLYHLHALFLGSDESLSTSSQQTLGSGSSHEQGEALPALGDNQQLASGIDSLEIMNRSISYFAARLDSYLGQLQAKSASEEMSTSVPNLTLALELESLSLESMADEFTSHEDLFSYMPQRFSYLPPNNNPVSARRLKEISPPVDPPYMTLLVDDTLLFPHSHSHIVLNAQEVPWIASSNTSSQCVSLTKRKSATTSPSDHDPVQSYPSPPGLISSTASLYSRFSKLPAIFNAKLLHALEKTLASRSSQQIARSAKALSSKPSHKELQLVLIHSLLTNLAKSSYNSDEMLSYTATVGTSALLVASQLLNRFMLTNTTSAFDPSSTSYAQTLLGLSPEADYPNADNETSYATLRPAADYALTVSSTAESHHRAQQFQIIDNTLLFPYIAAKIETQDAYFRQGKRPSANSDQHQPSSQPSTHTQMTKPSVQTISWESLKHPTNGSGNDVKGENAPILHVYTIDNSVYHKRDYQIDYEPPYIMHQLHYMQTNTRLLDDPWWYTQAQAQTINRDRVQDFSSLGSEGHFLNQHMEGQPTPSLDVMPPPMAAWNIRTHTTTLPSTTTSPVNCRGIDVFAMGFIGISLYDVECHLRAVELGERCNSYVLSDEEYAQSVVSKQDQWINLDSEEPLQKDTLSSSSSSSLGVNPLTITQKMVFPYSLLHAAITPTSCSKLVPFYSYEQLEVVGDIFLKLQTVTNLLYSWQVNKTEGEVTSIKDIIVNNKTLFSAGQGLLMSSLRAFGYFNQLAYSYLTPRQTMEFKQYIHHTHSTLPYPSLRRYNDVLQTINTSDRYPLLRQDHIGLSGNQPRRNGLWAPTPQTSTEQDVDPVLQSLVTSLGARYFKNNRVHHHHHFYSSKESALKDITLGFADNTNGTNPWPVFKRGALGMSNSNDFSLGYADDISPETVFYEYGTPSSVLQQLLTIPTNEMLAFQQYQSARYMTPTITTSAASDTLGTLDVQGDFQLAPLSSPSMYPFHVTQPLDADSLHFIQYPSSSNDSFPSCQSTSARQHTEPGECIAPVIPDINHPSVVGYLDVPLVVDEYGSLKPALLFNPKQSMEHAVGLNTMVANKATAVQDFVKLSEDPDLSPPKPIIKPPDAHFISADQLFEQSHKRASASKKATILKDMKTYHQTGQAYNVDLSHIQWIPAYVVPCPMLNMLTNQRAKRPGIQLEPYEEYKLNIPPTLKSLAGHLQRELKIASPLEALQKAARAYTGLIQANQRRIAVLGRSSTSLIPDNDVSYGYVPSPRHLRYASQLYAIQSVAHDEILLFYIKSPSSVAQTFSRGIPNDIFHCFTSVTFVAGMSARALLPSLVHSVSYAQHRLGSQLKEGADLIESLLGCGLVTNQTVHLAQKLGYDFRIPNFESQPCNSHKLLRQSLLNDLSKQQHTNTISQTMPSSHIFACGCGYYDFQQMDCKCSQLIQKMNAANIGNKSETVWDPLPLSTYLFRYSMNGYYLHRHQSFHKDKSSIEKPFSQVLYRRSPSNPHPNVRFPLLNPFIPPPDMTRPLQIPIYDFSSLEPTSSGNKTFNSNSNGIPVPNRLRAIAHSDCLRPFLSDNFYLELIRQDNLETIQKVLNYTFTHPALLVMAFIHQSSRSTVVDRITVDYQALELIGDAVLDFTIVNFLMQRFPSLTPDEVHYSKRSIVCNETLSRICLHGNFYKFLICDRDKCSDLLQTIDSVARNYTDASKTVQFPKELGDIIESIIGAVYMDSQSVQQCWAVINILFRDILHHSLQGHAESATTSGAHEMDDS